MNSVTLHNISKSYNKGATPAVQNVSFDVAPGELFGLIGPDGAGKTTLFRILTTLLLAESGNATVNGFDVVKDYKSIRKQVGYMPGKFSLYQDLTVEENLQFFATLFGTTIKENLALIKDIYVQIEPFKDRRAGKLSGGMKQKLALCCALIHKPAVLFLDEPTTGVDPVSRREFWEMLKTLKAQGITMMVSTPYMEEATLCDRIALVQAGHILSVDKPSAVIEAYPAILYAVKSGNLYHLLKDLRAYPQTDQCFAFGEYLHLSFKVEGGNEEKECLEFLAAKGYQNIYMEPIKASIEDCFIRLLKS
jgi:ABC-2 type transport system ATP-binding protein